MSADFLSTISGNAVVLPLNKEFDDVTAKFCSSIGRTDVCVSVIYKIHNPVLEVAFEARKKSIADIRKITPIVIDVFHGTTLRAAANIVNTGFNPAFSTVAAYGKGTYASPSANVAIAYCKDVRTTEDFSMIFLCEFIKGTCGKTVAGIEIDTTKMDYCTSGDILVTPYADGIIPKYLLCYYKWT
jgi:hypothetical protein